MYNYGFVILTRVLLSCSEVSPEILTIILTLILERNRTGQEVINKNKNQSRREFVECMKWIIPKRRVGNETVEWDGVETRTRSGVSFSLA